MPDAMPDAANDAVTVLLGPERKDMLDALARDAARPVSDLINDAVDGCLAALRLDRSRILEGVRQAGAGEFAGGCRSRSGLRPPALTIRYTRQAPADLEDALGYIARERPAAARVPPERVRAAINSLASFPNMGRPGRVPGTREFAVAPFVAAYRTSGPDVDVLAILHGARAWPPSFSD